MLRLPNIFSGPKPGKVVYRTSETKDPIPGAQLHLSKNTSLLQFISKFTGKSIDELVISAEDINEVGLQITDLTIELYDITIQLYGKPATKQQLIESIKKGLMLTSVEYENGYRFDLMNKNEKYTVRAESIAAEKTKRP
ncbi:MAG TPA: hypothetical protein VI612_01590, partial [Candidatus Nanoarchaeia archaeon]|nr:hypothetical protein [Candidatus Nanoarchaeia archaeon]